MKILIIGLGSMGKRRLRLMKKIAPDAEYAGVDNKESRRKESGILTFSSVDEALAEFNPKITIISTSPLSHNVIIEKCLKANSHVFTEINLVSDGYKKNIELSKKQNKILFLSSTFLYRDETKYIQKAVEQQTKPLSYRYHIGQYLPDWHPWESYKNYFVGEARTNGCRELMAIELPWLIKSFGKVVDFKVIKNKLTTLYTNYNDCVQLLLTHENGNLGSLCIDVVSRKAVRLFELVGEDIYLTWNGTPDTLTKYDIEQKIDINISFAESAEHIVGYGAFIIENAYTNEMMAFLDSIKTGENDNYGFLDDLETLKLIDRIEESI